MLVKFNPTGTHVHKGFLKVRFDLYPDIGDKTYAIHHILVPVIPPEGYQGKVDDMGSPVDQNAYNNWRDGLPKIWQLNPALCAFIRVPETVIKGELEDFTHQVFNKDTLKTLDDILIKPDSAHWLSPLMRGKLVLSDQKVQTKDITDLIGSVNTRFANLVLPLEGGGSSLHIEPQSIDIGAAAIDRVSAVSGETLVAKDNPANASGTIDTIEIWVVNDLTGCEVATFYVVSGNNLTTRDDELIGDVTAGSKQTFTSPGDFTALDVETGDYIGGYFNASIETNSSGGAGIWYKSGDNIPCINLTFSWINGYIFSLYGTGTEAGLTQAVGGGSVSIASTLNLKSMISVGAGSVTIAGALGSTLNIVRRLWKVIWE